MPEPVPAIHIARRPTSGVTAEGGDAFAATLLERAGFIPQSSIRQSWYRLHYDMGEDYENEKATSAYEMLTAAGYPVAIDPSLRLPEDRQRRPDPQRLLRIQAAQARTATGHAPAGPGSDETESPSPVTPQPPRRTR
ncbi:hypothetical protein ACH437_15180 [Streptomyces xinghaiensis]|uniref:hypothetical protein n=1 Tax=Streptomyces xinghaiensis TaxID=1038928 RepID=UPI0037A6C232